MRLAAIADDIRNTVSIRQAFERYGIDINNHGYAICPFHNEKTGSLKVYDKTFYCYGCGVGGDIVTLVMRLNDISFPNAIAKINEDFLLNLPIGRRVTVGESRKYRIRCAEVDKQRKKENKRREEKRAEYDKLVCEYERLDRNYRQLIPVDGQPMDSRFAEACHRREYIGYLLDNFDWRTLTDG